MFFLINEEKKIIFGYSPKCGCTKIKMYFNYYSGLCDYSFLNYDLPYNFKIPHNFNTYNGLPENHSEYKIILFIRNPYKRIVSGFIERYCVARYRLNIRDLNFEQFINELDLNGVQRINSEHFSPQLSQKYEDNMKFEKVFDIENIDFNYLDELFGKKMNENLVKVRTTHQMKYKEKYENEIPAFRLNKIILKRMSEKPNWKYFMNSDIINKINKFYKKDLDFFKDNGFDFYLTENDI